MPCSYHSTAGSVWLVSPGHLELPGASGFLKHLLLTRFSFLLLMKPPHIFALLKSPTYDSSARGLGTSEHYQHAVGGQSSPTNTSS